MPENVLEACGAKPKLHKENLRNYELPVDVQDLVNTIISGIVALAARAGNSNRGSNYLGGTSY